MARADVRRECEVSMDNEFILFDRLQKIRQVIGEYGEDNFCICFSGGKDSCVMSALIDEALPENKIPRVFADTGVELVMIRQFVERERERDERVVIINPSRNVKKILEEEGYPFKSKRHSKIVEQFQRTGNEGLLPRVYARKALPQSGIPFRDRNLCPMILLYQFEEGGLNVKVSDKCCQRLKKDPMKKWQKENKKPISIVGIMREEGGVRDSAVCLAFRGGKLKQFHPLAPLTKEWERWYIERNNVPICDIYKPPYNFDRTGCKGCPFNPTLQRELDTLEKFFPAERKQCEILWKPVYDEYRRIGYRIKDGGRQMNIDDFLGE
jgi:3'-phosphoadenosine 5'-phosphosulfate sulfotransferase (PAPS reductase)/FAD synthetase